MGEISDGRSRDVGKRAADEPASEPSGTTALICPPTGNEPVSNCPVPEVNTAIGPVRGPT